MKPYYNDDAAQIFHGDCLDVMAEMSANSIDTIITDPPYGYNFMGANWDHGIPGVEYWRSALRVAKPGAMLLAFGGTRTFHRLTCAIEDAGWEVRDDIAFLSSLDEKERAFYTSLNVDQQQSFLETFASQNLLLWVHGQGFPKSYDISKGIDAAARVEREVVGMKTRTGGGRAAPSNEGWRRPWMDEEGALDKPFQITAPATELAKRWNGWGTALKPAWEPIIVAMKPLDGTFASNAETWGVAGLNIEGARIETDAPRPVRAHSGGKSNGIYGDGLNNSKKIDDTTDGRWPTNAILDEEAGALLNELSGELSSGANPTRRNSDMFRNVYSAFKAERECVPRRGADAGGASRFFYCAKASASERGEGNNHPTVKPLDLMKYLCTLTKTPTGGVVLDPFSGSGTTLLAAALTGRKAIGIELNAEYIEIAKRRLAQGVLAL